MTVIRAHSQFRTILDFSGGKYSKNKVRQALSHCNMVNIEAGEKPNEFVVYHNEIKVGMYTIILHLPFDSSANWTRLRDYGDFEISVFDSQDHKKSRINLKKDLRFKGRHWVQYNFFGRLRIKHLIDVIAHCHRLDKLKAFL